ncbi:precorrin-6y C5,15-methyltransferase (decarboxylating) subunit CbiE [Sedimentibacter sp. MB31-C6]|uniref:precorrin-6y C5,15-methyltransferase (decarboxylating) subunit CbiE n=1 Tax=Sedimentibacter sp. MB31-C6 TaxID=3109366 RepID=UPI002DDD3351|nr:precorrin-6y C5,15-methyltransferase (decarboxylating) subunit CbiE [Sedimentibacter sp. MB36-C1]WSI04520.1 precorrin-6y C5,15-methyltransferase (decarboxylating) subunit CbiE [Sedimentibacter sp. MB36-C1]
MKKVCIVGYGIGNEDLLSKATIEAIESSDCIIGATRMINSFSNLNKQIFESINPEEIYRYILNSKHNKFSVLVSGDTGFYSLSKKLTDILTKNNIYVENISALSSLQYFCSKLNLSWEDIKYVSAHGRKINIISNVMFNKKVFILTGGDLKPNNICEILVSKNLGHLLVSVGENLSYNEERIVEDKASKIAKMQFGNLAVMIIHNDEALEKNLGLRSIKDLDFISGKVPMTKSEVRTVSISKLNLSNDSIVYDIGAGTGTVSIEIALKLYNGSIYSIEKNESAIELIKQNIKKFKAYNIELVNAAAPNGLINLPKPDCVFIGGSAGKLEEIIKVVLNKNPFVSIVINAISLQSLNEALKCMRKYKFVDVEIVNVSVSKSKKAGIHDMMIGQNPIYIISGKGKL